MAELKQRVKSLESMRQGLIDKNTVFTFKNYCEAMSVIKDLTEQNEKAIIALKTALNALDKTVIYSRKDGVWINSRVKGSAMWGLQDADDNVRESLSESARLNDESALQIKATLKALGVEGY